MKKPNVPKSEPQKVVVQEADAKAVQEAAALGAGTYEEKVRESEHRNTLTRYWIYRCLLVFMSLAACIFVFFILGMAMYLLFHYSQILRADTEKLEQFWLEVWRIMTSASFVASIVWIILREVRKRK
jgi:hypothetical protein